MTDKFIDLVNVQKSSIRGDSWFGMELNVISSTNRQYSWCNTVCPLSFHWMASCVHSSSNTFWIEIGHWCYFKLVSDTSLIYWLSCDNLNSKLRASKHRLLRPQRIEQRLVSYLLPILANNSFKLICIWKSRDCSILRVLSSAIEKQSLIVNASDADARVGTSNWCLYGARALHTSFKNTSPVIVLYKGRKFAQMRRLV